MKSNQVFKAMRGDFFFSSVEKSYVGFIVPKIPFPFEDIILVDINNCWIR